MVQWVRSDAFVVTLAHCIQHGDVCPLVRAVLHVGGSPCVDWSTQNPHRRFESGPTTLCTLVWIAHRRALREPTWVHENVEQFAVELLRECLSDTFIIFTFVYTLESLGWLTARRRRFTIGIRLDVFQRVHFSFQAYVESCARINTSSWHDYMRASPTEISDTIWWASHRDLSLAFLAPAQVRAAIAHECRNWPGVNIDEIYQCAMESEHARCLNPAEVRRLVAYRQKALASSGSCFYLICLIGQEPSTHPQFSTSRTMFAILKTGGIVWCDGPWCRPMTPPELLMCQGFPVYPDMFSPISFSSTFTRQRHRDRRQVAFQAGNSMPVPMAALAILWATFGVQKKSPVRLTSGLTKLVRGSRRSS